MMREGVRFSSKRLMLTLMLCACSVILLQNRHLSRESSFLFRLCGIAAGLFVCFLFFLPAVLLKRRYGSDVPTLVAQRPRWQQISVAMIYAAYFLYVAAYFLIPYTEMFTEKYYTDVSPCVIALLLLACCVYAAYKGPNVITRFGIFLFMLAMLTNFLLFGGSLSSLTFEGGFTFQGSLPAFWQDADYFMTPSFTAAVFACLAGDTLRFRLRQIIVALGLTGVKFALILFFITFAVGEYAYRQDFQTFVLSRVAHFGTFAGIESFYMALCTMSVFMILSLILCCLCRDVGKRGSLTAIAAFTGGIFLLHFIAANQNSVKELLMQPIVLNGFSLVTAVILPLSMLIGRGEKKCAKALR